MRGIGSPREKTAADYERLLLLASEGLTYCQMADRVGSSDHSVRRKFATIRELLQAKNMTHAVAMFVKAQYEAPGMSVFEWAKLQYLSAIKKSRQEAMDNAIHAL